MLYLILLLPLALAALSLIRNDRARTVILSVGQALLLEEDTHNSGVSVSFHAWPQ